VRSRPGWRRDPIQVPVEVRPRSQPGIGDPLADLELRFAIGKHDGERLSGELLDASQNRGVAVKRRRIPTAMADGETGRSTLSLGSGRGPASRHDGYG